MDLGADAGISRTVSEIAERRSTGGRKDEPGEVGRELQLQLQLQLKFGC